MIIIKKFRLIHSDQSQLQKTNPQNKTKLVLIMLFILSFFPFVYADLPNGCQVALQLDFGNQSANKPIGVEQNWKSLSFIGILVSSVLISIIYIIAKSLDNSALMARAKTDLIQIVVTLFLLGGLYGIIALFCSIDPHAFGIDSSSFFDAANQYFLYAKSKAIASQIRIMDTIMAISSLSSISVNAPSFIPLGNFFKIGLYARLFSGLSITLGGLAMFSNLVMLAASFMYGYMFILNAIQTHLLNLFLPVGIVLRCFSPTRDLGGVFIALSIGLWFFYPLLFTFSYMIIGTPDPEPLPSIDGVSSVSFWIPGVATLSAAPFAPVVIWPGLLSGELNSVIDKFNDAYASVGETFLSVFILPAINWIILAAIVRELSKAFGQEVDISGLSRLV